MATSSYYKAAEWAKSIKVNKIESLEWLTDCTIRQLRAIADKINTENQGWVFCKATLGKILGRLTKAELAVAIWDFVSLKRSAPRCKYFDVDECGNVRIVTERPGSDASAWTTNIGFNDYNSAEKVQKFLHTNAHCNASVIRLSKRCDGWRYELKVWLLSEKALSTLIAKENSRLNLERKPVIKEWDEQLKEVAKNNNLSLGDIDWVSKTVRLYSANHKLIGSVGKDFNGCYYNARPNSAVSNNISANSIKEAVEKLVAISTKVSIFA